ncbi:hypothetical protein [Aquimarina mytili]|uniref:Uncharacterized protein n=1 Tax=Aquimarina mytili TaxID=874423 RepID=A0A936ZRS7_9FLAO|nr:hypothetical protein [Aquimarina mytili]MBL0684449.1 hypothetical protein [Aquimarina mytili]
MILVQNIKSTLAFLVLPFLFYGQANNEEIAYYNWFDRMLGEEYTGLYNGKQYIDPDINKIFENKHSFFLSDKVLSGSITYNGQTYYNLGIKYNLETEQVIVTLKPGAVTSVIQLIADKITSFYIEDYKFVRLDNTLNSKHPISGFFQIITEHPHFILYKKNKKNRKERLEDIGGSKIYYEFTTKSQYILFMDKAYHEVNSKDDFISIFPETKQEIKSFYSTQKKIRKSDPDAFMKQLLEDVIYRSISKNNL